MPLYLFQICVGELQRLVMVVDGPRHQRPAIVFASARCGADADVSRHERVRLIRM